MSQRNEVVSKHLFDNSNSQTSEKTEIQEVVCALKAFCSVQKKIHIWRFFPRSVGWPRGGWAPSGRADRGTFYLLALLFLFELQLLKRKLPALYLQFDLLFVCWWSIRAAWTWARGTGGGRVSGIGVGSFGSCRDRSWHVDLWARYLWYRVAAGPCGVLDSNLLQLGSLSGLGHFLLRGDSDHPSWGRRDTSGSCSPWRDTSRPWLLPRSGVWSQQIWSWPRVFPWSSPSYLVSVLS